MKDGADKKQTKEEARRENYLNKVLRREVIKDLQERYKGSLAVQKANPKDEAISQYQSGRQAELYNFLTMLITPGEKVKLGKSKNPKNFLLSRGRLIIKQSE